MTNPATLRRTAPAIGNGVATSFPFTFKVFAASDVAVVRTTLETGAETVLTLGSDYLVSLNSDQDATPGGSVTYPVSGVPLDSDHSLTIYGDTDYTQDLDLAGGGKFNPTNIENALDRLSFQIQQLLEQMSRSLTAAVSTPSGADFTLPAPVADSLLGWDATGLKLKNHPMSTTGQNVTGDLSVFGYTYLNTVPGLADSSSKAVSSAWVQNWWAATTVADAKIVSVAWSKLTGTPTTVSGLGITDTVRRLLTGVALPGADVGLIWHDDYNSLMTWQAFTANGASYTGYASAYVGRLEPDSQPTARTGQFKTGSASLSKTGFYRQVWNWALHNNLVVALGSWVPGKPVYADNEDGTFRAPDLRAEYMRLWDDSRGVDVSRLFTEWKAGQYPSHVHEALLQSEGGGAGGFRTAWGGGAAATGTTYAAGGTENGSENRPRGFVQLGSIQA